MTRRQFIERVRRQIYGGQPSNDATITVGLVNNYLGDAIALAAKQNWKENIAIEGISYSNNGFYTTFKDIAITKDENFLWKVALPQVPVGVGESEGVEMVVFKDTTTGQISQNVVWMSQNERSFNAGRRQIPNKILAYQEGDAIYALSTILLSEYTASVTMLSGGDSTDLDSTLNVPSDYLPIMMQYLQSQLLLERNQPVDATNDGLDAVRAT